ncbi:retrovirus-related Pol polyprotein from transposon TNT 1-94 [Trichonephila clavipes]|nr:retrovirus-related Pol polyprotein from transposon TNT 1-94 [Trichonephila clavipes]
MVLTPNNWNTWKHDMQVLLMHYGCWQFIVQTKPEQPDEEASNIQGKIRSTTSRGFLRIQSTVQQIYRWKEEDFRVVKIEAELILEAKSSSVDETRFGESGECLLEQFHFEEVEDVTWCYGCSSWRSKMARMITKREVPDHYIITKSKEIIFSDVTAKTKNGSIEIWHQRFCHVNNDYLVKTSKNDSVKGLPRLTDNGKTRCIPCKLAKSKEFHSKRWGRKIKTSIGIVAYGPLWSNAN